MAAQLSDEGSPILPHLLHIWSSQAQEIEGEPTHISSEETSTSSSQDIDDEDYVNYLPSDDAIHQQPEKQELKQKQDDEIKEELKQEEVGETEELPILAMANYYVPVQHDYVGASNVMKNAHARNFSAFQSAWDTLSLDGTYIVADGAGLSGLYTILCAHLFRL